MRLLSARPPVHNTVPCFSWHQGPVSAPALVFTSFLLADTRLPQFWGFHVAAKTRWQKGFRSHFVKQAPRSGRLTFHPPHTPPRGTGLCHSQPLFSPTGNPGEMEFTRTAANLALGIFL